MKLAMRCAPTAAKLLLALMVGVSSGCGGPQTEPDAVRQAREAQAQAFTAGQTAWRETRKADLLRPDGWTTLMGLHWVDPGAHYLGSDGDNGIRLAVGPPHIGMLDRKGDRIRFVAEKGAELTLDGEPFKGSTALRSDADPAGPSRVGFDQGKGEFTLIKRGDRYAVRVRHADAPTRTGFKGIEHWPGGQDWIIQGRFVPNTAGKVIAVGNIIGTVEDVPNPGAIEFERAGQTYRLEALDGGEGSLFIVFHDRTSGKGSYPAGRFLDAAAPDAKGRVVLDFNKAYNPPCAFTAYATCPLPPPENRLNLEVVAGEKNYSFEERKHP